MVRRLIAWTRRAIGAGVEPLAAAMLAAWLLGRLVSDRTAWSQWLLWIPTSAALAVAVTGTAWAVVRWRGATPGRKRGRRRALGGWIACLSALAVYFALVEHRLPQLLGPCDRSGISIMHWNLNHFGTKEPEYVQPVIDIDADVTILTSAGFMDQSALFQEWLSRGRMLHRTGPFMIASRLPILETRWFAAAERISLAFLTVDGGPAAGGPLTIWIVDLPSALDVGRMSVARRVRSFAAAQKPPRADLMIGDFNITRHSQALEHLAPGYRDAFDLAGRGLAGSFPRPLPLWHIDHVLAAPDIAIGGYEVIDAGIGAHCLQRVYVRGRRRP
jgi:hypothetical protein